MQHQLKEFNEKRHVEYHALTVKQPWADMIAQGIKSVEIRSKNTSYRGEVLITSSATPVAKGRSGITICTVNLIDSRKITPENIHLIQPLSCVPINKVRGYAWLLTTPKMVDSIPVKGQLGIHRLILDKGDINTDDVPDEMHRELLYYPGCTGFIWNFGKWVLIVGLILLAGYLLHDKLF